MMQFTWEEPTGEDLQTVREQLGREPEGVIGVVVRCRYGQPQVVISSPLRYNGKTVQTLPQKVEGSVGIFPTLVWLTCPYVREAIGRLESTGWIGRLKEELLADPEAQEELQAAHARTAEVRRSLVPAETLERLEKDFPGQYEVLAKSGVAGMRRGPDRDSMGIKCLHAHFADYLATGSNPVGRRVWGLLTASGTDPRGWGHCFRGPAASCTSTRRAAEAVYGVIDVGSNSIRLLVARIGADGQLTPLATELIMTRLAETAEDGQLTEAAVERTLDAIKSLRKVAQHHGAADLIAVGTGALREAPNRADLLVRAWEEAGVSVRVISGAEEGAFAFRGALGGVRETLPDTVLLCDVGGASTELVLGQRSGTVLQSVSVPLGAVRLMEAVNRGDKVEDHLEALRARVKEFVAEAAHLRERVGLLLGVGGTATTLAAVDQALAVYDPDKVTGHRISHTHLREWFERLQAMPVDERKKLAGMPAGRADILPYGLLILDTVMEAVTPWLDTDEITVSDHDLLQGVIYAMLEAHESKT